MTGWQLLARAWDWEPSVLIGCGALLVFYFWTVRWRPDWTGLYCFIGVALLLLALVSPIDVLSDTYLFSVHMVQHIILAMVVPPLLLLGLPAGFFARLLRQPWARRIERGIGQPAMAWVLGNATLWIWHLPVLYNAALASEKIHIFQHLTFLVTGTIFWWPVLAPPMEERLAPIPAIGYLLAASASNTLLGIMLTFIPPGLYPAYLHPDDALHLLPLIRGTLGLDAEADQQVGGALMWVLGGIIYFWAIMAMLINWYHVPEAEISSPEAVASE